MFYRQRYITRRERYKSRRTGNIVILVALALVMLLGCCALAVDYGRMVATKNLLQRACDASALAGAAELPATDISRVNSAMYYAQLTATHNKVPAAETAIAFPSVDEISVTANRQVNFLFAPVLGLKSGTVRASAVAGRSNIAGVPYCVPLAITVDDYQTYRNGTSFEVRLIDNNRQDFDPGNVVALDLRPGNQGKSPALFQEDLTNGWDGPIFFNQQINNTLNASLNAQGQKLDRAMSDRFERAAGAPWFDNGTATFPDYPAGTPRIITLLVADPNPQDNSNPHVNARYFASVYVESLTERSGDSYLRIRILPGVTFNNEDPNIIIGDHNTPRIGFTVIRLMR